MHSRFIAVFAACFLLLASFASATAQEATPAAGSFADLGLPTLDVTMTEDGYEGISNELPAGRYLVTLTSEVEEGWLSFMQPTTVSPDEFVGLMAAMSQATPTDAGDDAMAELLAAYSSSIVPGGLIASPGQPEQMVMDFVPGEWLAWTEDPAASQQPVTFTVIGEMPSDLPEPASSATITMSEYTIEVTEGALGTGTQIIKVENIGDQPHFIEVMHAPDDITTEDFEALLQQDMADMGMGGTPTLQTDLTWDDLEDGIYTPTQSSDTTIWLELTLDQPGMYVVACWFPDAADGAPHAFHGMYTIVEVVE